MDSAEYRVYEQPVESRGHTSPLPPAAARTLAVNPVDAPASPLGWHHTGTASFTIMRGNNVHAFEDRDGNASNGLGAELWRCAHVRLPA